LKDPCLEKALHVVETMNFSKNERDWYEDHLKYLRMEVSVIKKVKAESEARGIAKGRAEEQVTIAKNMLKKGAKIEFIAEVTELSLNQVESLRTP
jgi:predicted transposase/invertase (TIGR01784 family)